MTPPVWPAGPLWFLWQLLAYDLILAGFFLLIPRSAQALAHFAAHSSISSRRCFVILLVFSAGAYIPLALIFGPWSWIYFGPTAIQPDRVLRYGIYFLAGAGIGAYGLQNGLLSTDGPLARHWRVWLAAAAGSFLLWMICMAPLRDGDSGMLLSFAAYFTVALLVTSACFCFIAVSLRFATGQSAICNSLSDNAYRIYGVHYVFIVWLQYLLLDATLPAIVKGTSVFVGTLALSWGVAAALGQVIALLMRAVAGGSTKFAATRAAQDGSFTSWARGATRHDAR